MTSEVSVSESYGREDASVEWVEFAPWANRYAIRNVLVGGWYNVGGFMVYFQPTRFINSPGLTANNVQFEPLGDINEVTGDWQTGVFTVSYGPPDEQDDVEFGSFSLDLSMEAFSLPKGTGGVTWSEGPDSGNVLANTDITPQKKIFNVAITLNRKFPFLQLDPLLAAVGRVNSDTVTVGDKSFDPEWLLMAGASASKKVTTDSSELWDYQFKFMGKSQSWNKIYHKSGTFYGIDPPVYDQAALGDFFV